MFHKLSVDWSVTVVTVEGTDKSFSAGAALSESSELTENHEKNSAAPLEAVPEFYC